MKKYLVCLLYCFLFPLILSAQDVQDTLNKARRDSVPSNRQPVKQKPAKDSLQLANDSLKIHADSLQKKDSIAAAPVVDTAAIRRRVAVFKTILLSNPYYNFGGDPVRLYMTENTREGSELFFYLLLGLFFYYALIRVVFFKYLSNIFTLFFRATLRQQQIREQLTQTPLPSLLLNILFVIAGGLYIALLARHYGIQSTTDFWLLCVYAIAGLVIIYVGKYLVLKTLGWILRISKATDTYLFIVFMVNKITGIFLLPVLLFLAFPFPQLLQVVITLSLFVLAVLWGYRFLLSYRAVRGEIRVNPFHFFLYLCAFEIAPLLLIYKVLLSFVERTH